MRLNTFSLVESVLLLLSAAVFAVASDTGECGCQSNTDDQQTQTTCSAASDKTKIQTLEQEDDFQEATIYYTVAASPSLLSESDKASNKIAVNGVNLDDPLTVFGTKDPSVFRSQHGTVPREEEMKQWSVQGQLAPVRSKIYSGRGQSFELLKNGFELVNIKDLPAKDGLESEPPLPTDITPQSDPDVLDTYSRTIERVAKRATGAKAAYVFNAHTWRGGDGAMAFGSYAHTDVGIKSWCVGLDLSSASRTYWPPTLQSVEFPENVTSYAVATAWRLLKGGQKSHLAMLDHRSLGLKDVLNYTMMAANNTFGSNYRLKAPDDDSDSEPLQHKWYYWPEFEKDSEFLFFLAHHPSLPTLHSQFHAAFATDAASGVDPERRSVDTRMLLVF